LDKHASPTKTPLCEFYRGELLVSVKHTNKEHPVFKRLWRTYWKCAL